MAQSKKVFLTEEEKLEKKRNMSYTERFDLLMRLIKISKMLKNATIIHSDAK